jgi:hypothetical protein
MFDELGTDFGGVSYACADLCATSYVYHRSPRI